MDFVHEERKKQLAGDLPAQTNIAHQVVDEALRKETRDNITVMVVFFKH